MDDVKQFTIVEDGRENYWHVCMYVCEVKFNIRLNTL